MVAWQVQRFVFSRELGEKCQSLVLMIMKLPCLDIVTCVVLIQTNHGKVNLLMHEYAHYDRGNTIHSPCQIEWFQNECHDKSHPVGGNQVINV